MIYITMMHDGWWLFVGEKSIGPFESYSQAGESWAMYAQHDYE